MHLRRRDFLKLVAATVGSRLIPPLALSGLLPSAPAPLRATYIPEEIRAILALVPRATIDEEGYLFLQDADGSPPGRVTLAPTLWNLERNTQLDRLDRTGKWAIVLHWFGDGLDPDLGLEGYLRGFDSLRQIESYFTTTSTHFLVGDHPPVIQEENEQQLIGIIQTQRPSAEGIPTLGSHLKQLDYALHNANKQYFVRALYQLAYANPKIHSILQDWFDGRRIDPNWVSIGIEITGMDFDSPGRFPSDQKVANLISLIRALMLRYQIPAENILGHHEIDLKKSDPGKVFIAFIRWLIAIMALTDPDPRFRGLVFGRYAGDAALSPITQYLTFIRDYHVLVARPIEVYGWEQLSGYWFVLEQFDPQSLKVPIADHITASIYHVTDTNMFDPKKHQGVDLFVDWHLLPNESTRVPVHLIANGTCVYLNNETTFLKPRAAIFRHRLGSGAEVYSTYEFMTELIDLKTGKTYAAGQLIGYLSRSETIYREFLRVAIAYSATWDKLLKIRPYILPGTSEDWVAEHYINPRIFMEEQNLLSKLRL